jgi:hypothetical protein
MMPGKDAAAAACSLSKAEWRHQTQAWQAITDSALRAKTAIPRGVRLTFEPDHTIAHSLLDLTTAERDCCAWATWQLTSTSDATLIEVTADGQGTETLQTMFEVTS